jgi:hypothetical protein
MIPSKSAGDADGVLTNAASLVESSLSEIGTREAFAGLSAGIAGR